MTTDDTQSTSAYRAHVLESLMCGLAVLSTRDGADSQETVYAITAMVPAVQLLVPATAGLDTGPLVRMVTAAIGPYAALYHVQNATGSHDAATRAFNAEVARVLDDVTAAPNVIMAALVTPAAYMRHHHGEGVNR